MDGIVASWLLDNLPRLQYKQLRLEAGKSLDEFTHEKQRITMYLSRLFDLEPGSIFTDVHAYHL